MDPPPHARDCPAAGRYYTPAWATRVAHVLPALRGPVHNLRRSVEEAAAEMSDGTRRRLQTRRRVHVSGPAQSVCLPSM